MGHSLHRANLLEYLSSSAEHSYSWSDMEPLIKKWWRSYKDWERHDTFTDAFNDNRMSVRTFPANFQVQVLKSVGLTEPLMLSAIGDKNRFFDDGKYTPVPNTQRASVSKEFRDEAQDAWEKFKPEPKPGAVKATGAYWGNRALESSAFANPYNFATLARKYDWGLHDLSASLLNSNVSIFDQIHNTGEGAHFSFMPLAQPEDQQVIYALIRMAKAMRTQWPEMYQLIMYYRARMTRVKLAANFDMGTGFIAIPVKNPGPRDRKFRLRYGLVSIMTVPEDVDASKSIKVTPEVYAARQQAALNYRSILDREERKNEIIIALREHEGDFPVYAKREGAKLLCYDIVGGRPVFNGGEISAHGKMIASGHTPFSAKPRSSQYAVQKKASTG